MKLTRLLLIAMVVGIAFIATANNASARRTYTTVAPPPVPPPAPTPVVSNP